MAINPRHLDQIADLPQIYGDPFDRLIISQARAENLAIVTRGSIIHKYNVNPSYKQIEKEASLARKRKAFPNMLKMREQAGENEKV